VFELKRYVSNLFEVTLVATLLLAICSPRNSRVLEKKVSFSTVRDKTYPRGKLMVFPFCRLLVIIPRIEYNLHTCS